MRYRNELRYPAFQFDDDGQPRPEIQSVLEAFAERHASDWEVALWFMSPHPRTRRPPAEMLDDEPERVATAGASEPRHTAVTGAQRSPLRRRRPTLDPLTMTWPAGKAMWRVHKAAYRPDSFNPDPVSSGRFRPFKSGRKAVPTAYVAEDFDAAVSESVFHELDPRERRISS